MSGYWLHNNGNVRDTTACPGEGLYCKPRPVIVLDPDDFGQVDRLLGAMVKHGWTGLNDKATTDMQAALRRLLPTPKPPEPMGLGAVVEDASGLRWTRVEPGDQNFSRNPWYPAADAESQPDEYRNIAAARVLGDGVS